MLFKHTSHDYARFRPRPPAALVPLLQRYTGCKRPRVIDLGCGTGLSTELWLGHASALVGLDPSEAMLDEARRRNADVTWIQAQANDSGLASRCADIVVAVQSFHWMEPESTLREIARLLRPGGVFVTADTALPPMIHPELDEAFEAYLLRASCLTSPGARWDNDHHLLRMHKSRVFSYIRELQLHSIEQGDSERLLGLARSAIEFGRPLDADETSAIARGLHVLRSAANKILGEGPTEWTFGYQIRLGVRA